MQFNTCEVKSELDVLDPMCLIACSSNRKRRGRPCATERRTNEMINDKFTKLIRSGENQDEEFTKNRVIPFIIKRQRRSRANDRERGRMENLNSALITLKQHIPLEMFKSKLSGSEDETSSSCSTTGGKSRSKSESKTYSKITKIDTLRYASEYISLLTNMLKESDTQTANTNRLQSSIYDSYQSSCSNNSSPVYNQQISHQEMHYGNYSPELPQKFTTNTQIYGSSDYRFNIQQNPVHQKASYSSNDSVNYNQFSFANSYQNPVGFYNYRPVNMYNY